MKSADFKIYYFIQHCNSNGSEIPGYKFGLNINMTLKFVIPIRSDGKVKHSYTIYKWAS